MPCLLAAAQHRGADTGRFALLLLGAQAWFQQKHRVWSGYGDAVWLCCRCEAVCRIPLCCNALAMLHPLSMQPAARLVAWRQVHVAYQTSGAIAVWDHDARRFAAFARHLPAALGLPANGGLREKLDGVAAALDSKRPGEARPGPGSRVFNMSGVAQMRMPASRRAGCCERRSQLERHRC